MYSKSIIIGVMCLFAVMCYAAETDVNSTETVKKIGDKYVSISDYWDIRSEALTELMPFLTRIRTEAKGHYKALAECIKSAGKGEEYLKSGAKGKSSPAEYAKLTGKAQQFEDKGIKLPDKFMTWEQLMEFAMVFQLKEGYVPTDVNGADEIEMFKTICEQKEKYGRKVQADIQKLIQDCMDMKAYLDSIGQFEACIKMSRYQKEQKDIEKSQEMDERKAQRLAREQEHRETKRQERDAIKEDLRREATETHKELNRRMRLDHSYYSGSYGGYSGY